MIVAKHTPVDLQGARVQWRCICIASFIVKKLAQIVEIHSHIRVIRAKGFFINGLTPMVLVFWLGTIGVATTKLGYDTPAKAIPFFLAIVATVFITDIIKAKLADKLREVLTPKFVRTLNLVLGIALLIFGCRLIFMADEFHVL